MTTILIAGQMGCGGVVPRGGTTLVSHAAALQYHPYTKVWEYDWKTPIRQTGCVAVKLTLADGRTHAAHLRLTAPSDRPESLPRRHSGPPHRTPTTV